MKDSGENAFYCHDCGWRGGAAPVLDLGVGKVCPGCCIQELEAANERLRKEKIIHMAQAKSKFTANLNALKEEIAGLNKHRKTLKAEHDALKEAVRALLQHKKTQIQQYYGEPQITVRVDMFVWEKFLTQTNLKKLVEEKT